MIKKIAVTIILIMVLLTTLSTMPAIGMQTQGSGDWWLMSRHDAALTGYSISDAPDTNNLKWSRQIDDNTDIYFETLVYDDKIYIFSIEKTSEDYSCGNVYCLNSDDGAELWSKKITDDSFMTHFPGGGINNDKLYVSSNRFSFGVVNFVGWLKCMNLENGYVYWDEKFIGMTISPPVFFDDKMYIKAEDMMYGMQNAAIYCVSENGNKLWSFEVDENYLFALPAVDNNRVYVASQGFYDEKVYCLDADDGEIIWQSQEDYYDIISVTIENENVYIVTSEAVYSLDANNGEEQWMQDIEGDIYYNVYGSNGPAVINDKVYIASTTYINPYYYWTLYCFDESGIIWSSQQFLDDYNSPPTIADGKVYIGSGGFGTGENGFIHCFNAETGDIIWNETTSYVVYASPSVAEGRLYVCSSDGVVYTFEKLSPSNNPPNAPSISGLENGNVGEAYEYSFVAIDPDGDNIKYFIDWGDGKTEETDYYASNVKINVSHTWDKQGTYEIKAKAIDINDAEGPFGYLGVTMPRNRLFTNTFFMRLIERFSNIFPILRLLLR